MASIVVLTGGDRATPLAGFADEMKHELHDLTGLLKQVAEECLQPAFGRNYDRSGLSKGSGVLKQALTKTGAKGNFLQVRAQSVTAGVDYTALPYARYVIEGRGQVVPKRRKALAFDVNGKTVFTKHSKAAPPHPLVYLTPEAYERMTARFTELLIAKGGVRLGK